MFAYLARSIPTTGVLEVYDRFELHPLDMSLELSRG